MDNLQYQGLFYLSTGVGTFVSLLLGLRTLGSGRTQEKTRAAAEDGWNHKESLKVVEIIEESSDIKSFLFKREGNRPFPRFAPGQFLSFQIGEEDKCLRSYSLSGSVANRETLRVSIKRLDNGKGSGWFHARRVGDRVWAFPPSGHFTDAKLASEPRVYVAGGIGITPLLSMVLSNLDGAGDYPLNLFYAARTPKDLAFHDLLVYLSARHRRFRYHPVVSAGDATWTGEVGRLSADYIKEKLGAVSDPHYFFCGPPPLTNAIVEGLLKAGVQEDCIHSEKFASPQALDVSKIPHREANVIFQGETHRYQGKQTLLEFLESRGRAPAFACRVGVCGTCKMKLQGKVELLTDAGLTPAEKREGLTLTCVAYPESDVTLE